MGLVIKGKDPSVKVWVIIDDDKIASEVETKLDAFELYLKFNGWKYSNFYFMKFRENMQKDSPNYKQFQKADKLYTDIIESFYEKTGIELTLKLDMETKGPDIVIYHYWASELKIKETQNKYSTKTLLII